MSAEISLLLSETLELADGFVRLDMGNMRLLGISSGDVVSLSGGAHTTYARVLPARMEERNQGLARVSAAQRRNIGLPEGRSVTVARLPVRPEMADLVTFAPVDDIDHLYLQARLPQLATLWHDRIVVADDVLTVPTMDRYPMDVVVTPESASKPMHIVTTTRFELLRKSSQPASVGLAGLRDLYRTCDSLARQKLYADSPKAARSVLLTGQAGCGKAQLVKKLAAELKVHLRSFDMHQLLDEGFAEGKDELDNLLTELARFVPMILMFDNLEALNTHPNGHRALTKLCALLDDLPLHDGIMVFGLSAAAPDVRLISGNRFDLVFSVEAPDRLARHEMLLLETQDLPLDSSVDLGRLAAMTRGATMADLRLLVSTARLIGVRPFIYQDDFVHALRSLHGLGSDTVHCDIPLLSWDQMCGIDEVKSLLRETLSWSLTHHHAFDEANLTPPRTILITGASGTGKTSLARAVASVIPLRFIEITCPTLVTRDQVTAARTVSESFAMARRNAPCLIFFDDIDALLPNDDGESDAAKAMHPIVAQILLEIDRLSQTPGVLVLASTDRPDRLSSEMTRPGRFDYSIALPLPDHTARRKIIQVHACKLPLASDVDFDKLADMTQNLTAADLAGLCHRAGLLAVRQSLNNEDGLLPPVVTAALFEQVMRGRKN